jgi:hypothetical protein
VGKELSDQPFFSIGNTPRVWLDKKITKGHPRPVDLAQ